MKHYQTRDLFEVAAYKLHGHDVKQVQAIAEYNRRTGRDEVMVWYIFEREGLPVDEYRDGSLMVPALKLKLAHNEIKLETFRIKDGEQDELS